MGRVSANNECELILISPIQQASFSESFARIDWFASFSDGCFVTTFQTLMKYLLLPWTSTISVFRINFIQATTNDNHSMIHAVNETDTDEIPVTIRSVFGN